MATKQPKADTESAADMEARIRLEVEARVRAEFEQKMRAEIEAQVRAGKTGTPVRQTRVQAAKELAEFLKSLLPEKPRYRLTEKAYLGDILYEPELKPWKKDTDPENPEREPLFVFFEGRPGPHMKPVNKAAEAMYAKYPPVDVDPIAALSIVGEEGTEALKQMTNVG